MKKEQNTTFIPPSTVVEDAVKPVKNPSKRTKNTKKKLAKEENSEEKKLLEADDLLEETLDFDEQNEEKPLTALDLIRKKSGLSEDDVAMIFELGYENELGRLVGYENLKQFKAEHLKLAGKSDSRHYRTAFGYRGEEYTGKENRAAVCAAYTKDRKFLILRTVLSAFLTLLLLFADMPQWIASGLPAVFSENRLVFPLIGMALLILLAIVSHKQLNAGLRSLLKFEPTPYSVPALLLPITLIYDVVSLFLSTDMIRVNFLSALPFLAIVICDLLRFSCERRTLGLLSTEKVKHTLIPATPRKKKMRQGNKIIKIINDDIGKNRYHVRQCQNTVGFFRRFNDMKSTAYPLVVLISLSFAIAVLIAFTTAIFYDSIGMALSAFMQTVLLSVPTCAILSFFFPIWRANRLLAQVECAILGEETVEEYNTPKTVIFHDTDLYRVEKRTEISVAKNEDLKNDLRLAGILFRKLGGTLAEIGGTAKEGNPHVSILRVSESGVEAMIDNRHHILAGDGMFLARNGISVPRESTDKTLRRTSEVSLMYIAIDGALKLSYEVEYEAKASFERMVCDLAEIDCEAAISSLDPNLDDVFLQKSRFSASDPISVIKPNRFEDEAPLELADVGVVALGEEHDLIYPLFAAYEIAKVKRFGFRMQLIAAILGGALTALLTLLGEGATLGILPILGYQCFFGSIAIIAGLSEISTGSLRMNKKY